MTRWVDTVIAHRKRILAAWVVLFLLGGAAAANLGGLLRNRFSVPGAESERGLNLIQKHMGDRSDGSFTLVATGVGSPAERAEVQQRRAEGRHGRPARQGRPAPRRRQGRRLRPDLDAARERGREQGHARRCARDRPSAPASRRTCPAFPRSTTTRRRSSTRTSARGESIAIPIALLVMAFMFGTLGGIAVPFVVRRDDDPDHARPRVDLRPHDGHGDLRDEHRRADRAARSRSTTRCSSSSASARSSRARPTTSHARAADDDGHRRPGDAVLRARPSRSGSRCSSSCRCRSCARWASAACSSRSSRSPRRRRCCRRCWRSWAAASTAGGSSPSASSSAARPPDTTGFWHRLATAIMRRPVAVLLRRRRADARARAPRPRPRADRRRQPRRAADHRVDARACTCSRRRSGPGALAPHQIVVDTHRAGGASDPALQRGRAALRGRAAAGPATRSRARSRRPSACRRRGRAPGQPRRRATGRVIQIRVAGRTDSGDASRRWTSSTRIRDRYVPAARFPRDRGAADRRARVRRRLHRQGLRRVPVARARGARRSPT